MQGMQGTMNMSSKKMMEAMKHFDEHVSYPATKEEIVEECNRMDDMPKEDKQWVIDNLPDKSYMNADEVKEALKMKMEE